MWKQLSNPQPGVERIFIHLKIRIRMLRILGALPRSNSFSLCDLGQAAHLCRHPPHLSNTHKISRPSKVQCCSEAQMITNTKVLWKPNDLWKHKFYSKTPEFWPVTEVFTWQQLISPSFACVFGVCIHISLCKLSVTLPLEVAGDRLTQCCCEIAGLCHSSEGWRTGGSFIREPSLMDPWTATSQLPFPRSHGDTSQMTDGSVQTVFTMCFGGNDTKCFFLSVLWSLLCPGRKDWKSLCHAELQRTCFITFHWFIP